jgi:hypothetical protein
MKLSKQNDDGFGEASGKATQRNLRHFDHTFKGEIHTVNGTYLEGIFGETKFAKREIQLNCKGTSFEIVEEIGLKSKKHVEIPYQQVFYHYVTHLQYRIPFI